MKSLLLICLFLLSQLFATNINDYINRNNCDQIIDKEYFTICYDYKYKGAIYVSYQLKGNLVNQKNIKKRPSFYSEKTIPNKYRSKSKDYRKSGYDRGHLASDASFDWSKKSQKKTYTMANVIPQAPKVNRKAWIKVEKLERLIAVKLGNVNVLNGIVYGNSPKRIGKNKIAVPKGFWKMIYNDKMGYKKCFYYENDNNINTKKDKLRNHLIECNKLY